MKRAILIALAFLALAATAYWLWPDPAAPPGERIAAAPPDYQGPGGWAARPAQPPPAVWEEGWATDVLLLTSEAALNAVVAEQAEKQLERGASASKVLAASFQHLGPVYAPYYRVGAETSDIPRSLETYLEQDNRGRAFLIVTDSTLPAGIGAVISSDTLTHERFAGILWAGAADRPDFSALFQPPLAASEVCSRRFADGTGCAETVSIDKGNGELRFADNSTESHLLSGFNEWLAANATRLAEPLGQLEDIEIVDIRSPGDTD